jgi:hypothetical protein
MDGELGQLHPGPVSDVVFFSNHFPSDVPCPPDLVWITGILFRFAWRYGFIIMGTLRTVSSQNGMA